MFTYPSLLVALPLAGVVVLIHLIQMFRHRRVPWAAFEFLLASYKRYRTRILFQQFLLMAIRMLAVMIFILALAQPQLQGHLSGWFGMSRATHFIIVLDDSFSMTDHTVGQTLFSEATGIVQRLAAGAATHRGTNRLTLLRTSQVQSGNDVPDLTAVPLDTHGVAAVSECLNTLTPSESATSPVDSLTAAVKWVKEYSGGSHCVVYFLSDFRRRDWNGTAAGSTASSLAAIAETGATVRFVRMANTHHGNLSFCHTEVTPSIRAAGVPMLCQVKVANYGPQRVENVPIFVVMDGRSVPVQTIAAIGSGEETTAAVSLRLPTAGPQTVTLQLEPDTIHLDNTFRMSFDLPAAVSVLLIDSEVTGGTQIGRRLDDDTTVSTSFFLKSALAPGGVHTGIDIQIQPPNYLSTANLDSVNVVICCDLPAMPPSAVRQLESFVTRCGHVVFFTGPRTDYSFVDTELFRGGNGIFPVPLLGEVVLEEDYLRSVPDFQPENHPIFRFFADKESSLLSALKIEKYSAIDPKFRTGMVSSEDISVLGKLRNGEGVVLEKRFPHRSGSGKTITFLTSAAPYWNDWGRGNPSYVVTIQDMVSHLTSGGSEVAATWCHTVGDTVVLTKNPQEYQPVMTLYSPNPTDIPQRVVKVEATVTAEGTLRFAVPPFTQSGIYVAEFYRLDGSSAPENFAVNVDFSEGDLSILEPSQLVSAVEPFGVFVSSAEQFAVPVEHSATEPLTDLFLVCFACLLAGEMFLAGRILSTPTKNRT